MPVLSKSEYAYAQIKVRILDERLPAGAVVNQEAVAAELSISTTPVREALRRLASEGLVHLDTHRDARVSALSAGEAVDLYEVRRSLDTLAAGLAAGRRGPDDVVAIRTALGRLEPLRGPGDVAAMEAHRAFHRAIYRSSHNPVLVGVLEGLWDRADRYRQVGLRARPDTREDSERVRAEHDALADAVVRGDADEAGRVMLAHIDGSLGRRAIEALGGHQGGKVHV